MSSRPMMMFVDGENLLTRYEEMLQTRTPLPEVLHSAGRYVWTPKITAYRPYDIIRVGYYTSIVGNDEVVNVLRQEIGALAYGYGSEARRSPNQQIYPRVFKRPASSRKSPSVDINITIDVMRAAHLEAIEHVFIVSGDGDYLPLIEEVMRRGREVTVGALSSGLNPGIRHSVDLFVDLDRLFFNP